MTTYYYNNNNPSHESNTTTTTQPQQQSNKTTIPKSIFTNTNNFGNDTTWLMTPLSPPLGNKEHQNYTAPPPPPPMLTTSTPNNRRFSTNSGAPWRSLWSTSSTWQPNDNYYYNNTEEQTSPIDLEFLDSPTVLDQVPFREQRSQSISVLPSYNAAVDDYFQFKNVGVVNNNQSATISSPLTIRRPYQTTGFIQQGDEYLTKNDEGRERSSSIWTVDWTLPVSSSTTTVSRDEERRHSMTAAAAAATAVVTQQRIPLTPPPQPQQQQQIQQLIQQVQQQQKIDEYFSPTSTMIDVQVLGKGLSLNQLKENQPIYQVQFKVKYRTDFFYVFENKEKFQLNDMVVVEADRGYDLGKVVSVIETKEQRKKKKLSDSYTIKRIFRKANQQELMTHEMKKQDEQKALIICQAKIKQKNLNMEVVDAEYQWDRRKLTFYFKANERIDFRELVRELFKIYKTRIWMCAYSLEN